MDGWTDGWTDGWMDGRMDGRTDGWTDGQMKGGTDGQMSGRREGRTDGHHLLWRCVVASKKQADKPPFGSTRLFSNDGFEGAMRSRL